MAKIIIADVTGHYDGRALETQALGGTESSVILTARGLARRGHDVTVHSHCEAELVHEGVRWRPLSAAPEAGCDIYIAVQQPELLGFAPRPKRRVIWVLWGANQLRHYKRFWRMFRYPPKPILMSLYQQRDYWPLLPGHGEIDLIHLPLPEAVRGRAAAAAAAAATRDLRLQPAAQSARAGRALGRADPAAGAGRGARRLRRQQPAARRGRLGRLGRHSADRMAPRPS